MNASLWVWNETDQSPEPPKVTIRRHGVFEQKRKGPIMRRQPDEFFGGTSLRCQTMNLWEVNRQNYDI